MSNAIDNLNKGMMRAAAIRPKVGGFPYLAETLRQAGVTRNVWSLPACQSLFLTNDGPIVVQGAPLVSGSVSGILIDEMEQMPSSSAYRKRFGSLHRVYSIVGFTPERDFAYIEINRALRDTHLQHLNEAFRKFHPSLTKN